MNRFFLTIVVNFSIIVLIQAQPLSFDSTEKFRIIKLPDIINSKFEEAKPMINHQADKMYFVRSYYPGNLGGENAGEDIWYCEKNESGKWEIPSNEVYNFNTPQNNIITGISVHEYFTDISVAQYKNHGNFRDITMVHYRQLNDDHHLWSYPMKWSGITLPTHQYHDFYVHPSHHYLLMSFKRNDGIGEEDLYIYLKEGQSWEGPIHLGTVINSKEIDVSPFLRDDGKRLYFASNRKGGFGSMDIWYSDRLDDGWTNWSEPKNLGPQVNSTGFDCYYFENDHGQAVFSSNRDADYADLYLIERAKEKVVSWKPAEMAIIEKDPIDLINRAINPSIFSYEIYFEHNKSTLNKKYLTKVLTDLRNLLSNNNISVKVSGYTDAMGSDVYNLALSQKRATFIAEIINTLQLEVNCSIAGFGKAYNTSRDSSQAWARKVVVLGYLNDLNMPE